MSEAEIVDLWRLVQGLDLSDAYQVELYREPLAEAYERLGRALGELK